MIFVDELAWRGAPWGGGKSSHLISDESVEELLEFALALNLPMHWYQPKSTPHFDLSRALRDRAIARGAVAAPRPEFVAALRRFRAAARARERTGARRYRDWLAAGPARGPYPGSGR